MLHIKRILCPVDFSDASRHALDHAATIARWYEAKVSIVHVFNPTLLVPSDFNERRIEEQMHEWLAASMKTGAECDLVFEEGSPAERILASANATSADMIVMGTHGREGFERLLLGSVAEHVLRHAGCPVLTVPPAVVSTSKLPFKRLLCPIDFSSASVTALQFAFSIANEAAAHLTILHVLDWPHDDGLFVAKWSDSPEYQRRREEQHVLRQLNALVTDDMRRLCEPTPRVTYGNPHTRILEVAAAEESDLIVIGLQGRNAVDLLLTGSTTNRVVRHASCPVLTLNGPRSRTLRESALTGVRERVEQPVGSVARD